MKKGSALLMVWAEVPADKEAEFNRWYNEEHIGERLAVPGFLVRRALRGGEGRPEAPGLATSWRTPRCSTARRTRR